MPWIMRETNPNNSVFIVTKSQHPNELPLFHNMFSCLTIVKEGFLIGCRKLIYLDGFFFENFTERPTSCGNREG